MAKRLMVLKDDIQNVKIGNNTLSEYVEDFVGGWVAENVGNSGFKDVEATVLKTYLSNPSKYFLEISNLIKYEQISNGNMNQLHEIMTSLPSLNHKIVCFNTEKKTKDGDLNKLNRCLATIRYKQIAREIMRQAHSDGTVVAMWLGSKENMYPHIFTNLNYIFPAFRRKGKWVCFVDLSWLDDMEEAERMYIFEELSPYITEADYNKYKTNTDEYKYKELPQERTSVIRFNAMSRNQRLGLSTGTQMLTNIFHKQTLKNLETAISDRIINSIPILTIGNKEVPNEKIPLKLRRQIGESVVRVLQGSFLNGKVGMVTLPEYSSLEWKKADGIDALDSKKYDSANRDISTDSGISDALITGEGNGSTAKYNLDILYKRIGGYLTEMEDYFQKYCTLLLGSASKNYLFEFEKDTPLTKKEQLDALTKLHAEGFSMKAIIDAIPNIDYETYIAQSIDEHKSGMYDTIVPPQTAYTMSSDGKGVGAPINEDPDSEETIISQDKDLNGGDI